MYNLGFGFYEEAVQLARPQPQLGPAAPPTLRPEPLPGGGSLLLAPCWGAGAELQHPVLLAQDPERQQAFTALAREGARAEPRAGPRLADLDPGQSELRRQQSLQPLPACSQTVPASYVAAQERMDGGHAADAIAAPAPGPGGGHRVGETVQGAPVHEFRADVKFAINFAQEAMHPMGGPMGAPGGQTAGLADHLRASGSVLHEGSDDWLRAFVSAEARAPEPSWRPGPQEELHEV